MNYTRLDERKFELQFYIDDEAKKTKELIDYYKDALFNELGFYITAVVCMTGDLAHPGHIAYVKAIRKKILDKYPGLKDANIKLFVGLEDEQRTLYRKGKKPILTNEERKYQWEHIKGVGHAFIWNTGRLYPSDLMSYLNPDIWATHQEYFPTLAKYLRTARKIRKMGADTKMLVITDKDTASLPEGDVRKKFNLSSSEITKRVIERQKDKVYRLLLDLDPNYERKDS